MNIFNIFHSKTKPIDPSKPLEISLTSVEDIYNDLKRLFLDDKIGFDRLLYAVFFEAKHPNLKDIFELLLYNRLIEFDYGCSAILYRTHDFNKRNVEIHDLYLTRYKNVLYPELEKIRKRTPFYEFRFSLSPNKFIIIDHPRFSNYVIDYLINKGVIRSEFEYTRESKTFKQKEKPKENTVVSYKEKDAYAILGIDSNTSKEDIKKKYRQLARKYHPDQHSGKDALEMMQKINSAYTEIMKKF